MRCLERIEFMNSDLILALTASCTPDATKLLSAGYSAVDVRLEFSRLSRQVEEQIRKEVTHFGSCPAPLIQQLTTLKANFEFLICSFC